MPVTKNNPRRIRNATGPDAWQYRYKGDQLAYGPDYDTVCEEGMQAELEIRRGDVTSATAGQMAVREVCERMLKKKRGIKPTTRKRHLSALGVYVWEPFEGFPKALGDMPIRKVNEDVLDDFVQALLDLVDVDPETGDETPRLMPRTIHRICSPLKMAFTYANDRGWIARNPWNLIDMPLASDPTWRPMTPDECVNVAVAADVVPLGYRGAGGPIMVTTHAGLRWGEIRGLKVADIDLVEGVIHVTKQLRADNVEDATKRYKKGDIPISERLRPWLEDAMHSKLPGALVFTTRSGRPLNASNYRRDIWLPAKELAKIHPATRFHDGRHSFGTNLADADVALEVIQELMMHSDPRTTRQYVHVRDQRKAKAIRALDALPADTPAAPLADVTEIA